MLTESFDISLQTKPSWSSKLVGQSGVLHLCSHGVFLLKCCPRVVTSWLIPTGDLQLLLLPGQRTLCAPLGVHVPGAQGSPWAQQGSGVSWSQLVSLLHAATEAKAPSNVTAQQLELPGSKSVPSFYRKIKNSNSEGNVVIWHATLTASPPNLIDMDASSNNSAVQFLGCSLWF